MTLDRCLDPSWCEPNVLGGAGAGCAGTCGTTPTTAWSAASGAGSSAFSGPVPSPPLPNCPSRPPMRSPAHPASHTRPASPARLPRPPHAPRPSPFCPASLPCCCAGPRRPRVPASAAVTSESRYGACRRAESARASRRLREPAPEAALHTPPPALRTLLEKKPAGRAGCRAHRRDAVT